MSPGQRGCLCGLDPTVRYEGPRAALATLDEQTRCAVVLRYYENLSSRQIGEVLDMSAAAVDMRLSRARNELKQKLAWADPATNGTH